MIIEKINKINKIEITNEFITWYILILICVSVWFITWFKFLINIGVL